MLTRAGRLYLIIYLSSMAAFADSDIDVIRQNFAKALEYEDQTAREQSDWRTQKEQMESLIILANEEEQALEEKLEASRAASDILKERKQALLDTQESRSEVVELLRNRLGPMVEEIKRQYPNWPSILQDETRNDLTILNNSPTEDFTIGDRKGLMAALDIIKKAGEFQAQINQGYMVKELPDGSEAMFAVIYMGLAQGYYFSEDLGLAGSIVFNGDQWVWKDDRKLLQSLISMSEYLRGNQQAALVELPLELNTDREGGTE